MRLIKNHYLLLSILVLSCRHEKIRVVSELYSSGNPKDVFYFADKNEAGQSPHIYIRNGIRITSPPVSVDMETFYDNGKPKCLGHYKTGLATGMWRFFDSTGTLYARCYYKDGIERDSVICLFPSQKVRKLLVETDTTLRYWRWTDFYESGQSALASHLFSDRKGWWIVDGSYREWYPDGQPKCEATVKAGWIIDKWKKWDEKGSLEEKEGDSLHVTF